MVVLPGEGAVESFIECLAVLFVPLNGSQDHLRGRKVLKVKERGWRDLGGKRGERK